MGKLAKPKLVEVTLRVRVPADMSVAKAKYEVSQAWYGEIYANAGTRDDPHREVVLFPRWSKARVVRR